MFIVYFIVIMNTYFIFYCCIFVYLQVPFTTQPAVASHVPKSRPFSGSQAAVAKRGHHGDRSHEANSIPYKQQQPVDLCVVSGRIVSYLVLFIM